MDNVKIRKYISPVPDDICQGVLDIVADNVTSLSMMHPLSSHPRFEAYRTALKLEIHNYLAMDEPFRLEVVTSSLDGVIIGFILCGLPFNGSSSECGIYYTAVAKPNRGRGIMSLMMREVTANYPSISLSCDIDLVPIYEHFGFVCDSLRHHQIVMFLGNPVENIPVIATHELMADPAVVIERRKAEANFSKFDIDRADKAMVKRLEFETSKAKRFLQARMRARK